MEILGSGEELLEQFIVLSDIDTRAAITDNKPVSQCNVAGWPVLYLDRNPLDYLLAGTALIVIDCGDSVEILRLL